MLSASEKLAIAEELLNIAAFQFVRRLKESRPSITEEEVEKELTKWYQNRPGAEFGDGPGTPVDLRKYFNDGF